LQLNLFSVAIAFSSYKVRGFFADIPIIMMFERVVDIEKS